ncbi:hypothetical protein [Leptospira kanakyensis]|uniref:hypothetical protein n=1 Tax=Leptospira kanakyensis TaxID=2484968 RepID=UPI00223E5171|nr:hypothetical protein [Leptospira kanakyensis]MCW7468666.1 hypothetical protein [Leptospira kanakyensis]
MKQLINFGWKFSALLILSFTLMQFGNCKLKLNNPRDPNSKSFMETWLWEEYLRSLCTPNARGSVRLGTGTYKTYPYKLLKLKNGNFLITAGVYEQVSWNGKITGKNFSFSGTPGSDLNGIAFIVNGRTFQIEWLDYLGQLAIASDKKEMIPVTELSNGDVVVAAYTNSAAQGNPISPKANTNSIHVIRFDSNGNRVWSSYLDKTDNSMVGNRLTLVSDSLDQIHLFFTGIGTAYPDTNGFGEFSTINVPSNGSTNQEEIGWAVLSQQGEPLRQRYLPSNNNTTVFNSILGLNESIILSGSAGDNFIGYTGHPLPSYNYVRPVVVNLSITNFSISNITYLGSINPTYNFGTVHDIVKGSDGFYGTGLNAGEFGTSIHPYQSTPGFRNNIFSKFDWNGNLIWNQFLGSTTNGALEIPSIISYNKESDSMKAYTYTFEDGGLYTGLTIPVTGTGINPFQMTTLTIAGTNGQYQSIHYKTSILNTPPGADDLLESISAVTEACGGRLVRLQSIQNVVSELGVLELATRPANEEP